MLMAGSVLLSFRQLIGHLHPVLVHLPIGILLIALLLEWLGRKERHLNFQPAVEIILFAGAFTAILSCISGYFLASDGEYDEDTLAVHKWMGISVALVSSFAYALKKGYWFQPYSSKLYRYSALLLLVSVILAGHLGGSLTHGANYLTQNLPQPFKRWLSSPEDTVAARKIIANAQEAYLYADLVAPIFQTKCQGCHGKRKQKGGLRLDQPEFIKKGGKDGVVITAGDPARSELTKRLKLSLNDEHHMPPKEKSQLTENEIMLLHWWILQGADFTRRVKEFNQSDTIKNLLTSFQSHEQGKPVANSEVPSAPVAAADTKIIDSLEKLGVHVMPLSRTSNYLAVSFVNAGPIADSVIRLLEPLSAQLIFLKLGNCKLSDTSLLHINNLKSLVRLGLEYTNVTDTGLRYLADLPQLRHLNLVGTRVTAKGILALKKLPQLETVYLYKTGVRREDWSLLQKEFPKLVLDSGGYIVPLLASDTTEIKPPKPKKEKKEKKENDQDKNKSKE